MAGEELERADQLHFDILAIHVNDELVACLLVREATETLLGKYRQWPRSALKPQPEHRRHATRPREADPRRAAAIAPGALCVGNRAGIAQPGARNEHVAAHVIERFNELGLGEPAGGHVRPKACAEIGSASRRAEVDS